MAEVAKANGVLFVDLFNLSQPFYARAAKQKRPLTFNGNFLTEAGDKTLAPEISGTFLAKPRRRGILKNFARR